MLVPEYFRKASRCSDGHVYDLKREVCPICGSVEFKEIIARPLRQQGFFTHPGCGPIVRWEERRKP